MRGYPPSTSSSGGRKSSGKKSSKTSPINLGDAPQVVEENAMSGNQTESSALQTGINVANGIIGDSDLNNLSERGNYILDMLETAGVNKLDSANRTIEEALKKGQITSQDAKIMKNYYRQYLNS